MNSPAHDIALYLQSLSFGTLAASSGWAIAVAREPVAPDTTITVYDTGGQGPDTDELDEFLPDIQVRVRAPDYIAAYAKSEGIRAALTLTQPIYCANIGFHADRHDAGNRIARPRR